MSQQHIKKAEQVVRMFGLELHLAQQTAYDVYFSRDPHIIWHCFKPFLGQRTVQDVRIGIAYELLPHTRNRPGWEHLIPMLEDLYKMLNLLDDVESYRCTFCRGR